MPPVHRACTYRAASPNCPIMTMSTHFEKGHFFKRTRACHIFQDAQQSRRALTISQARPIRIVHEKSVTTVPHQLPQWISSPNFPGFACNRIPLQTKFLAKHFMIWEILFHGQRYKKYRVDHHPPDNKPRVLSDIKMSTSKLSIDRNAHFR